jgi:hypothetical protein
MACNEVLGLDAGKPENGGGGGSAGAAAANGGFAMAPNTGGTDSGGEGGMTGGTGARAGNGSSGNTQGGSDVGGNGGQGGGDSGPGGSGADAGNAGSGGDGSCSSTTDCRERGFEWPYLCSRGTCVDVTSNECTTVLGAEWVDTSPEDEPYLVGAYARFDVADRDTFDFYWALKLAMQEFTDYGPIPIDGAKRRPVMILCNSPLGSDMTAMFRGLAHLIDRLEISAILMLPPRLEMQAAAQYAFVSNQKDVFLLDFGGANFDMLRLDDGGRLWHMLGDTYLMALPFVPLVERVEEHVNPGASSGGAQRPTKLALVADPANDGYHRDVSQNLRAILRINGAPVDGAAPDTFLDVPIAAVATIPAQVAEFEPDIVVDYLGAAAALQADIDSAMRAKGKAPPFYVLPADRLGSAELVNAVRADSTLRTRIVGINYGSATDSTLYRDYLERVDAFVPAEVDLRFIENVYDSVYFLLYAAVAGGSGGTQLQEGMRRLVAGTPRRDVGPGDAIQSVLDRLANPDARLSLYGASGEPDFHLPTGARIQYGSVWCIDENLDWAPDEMRYDPVTEALVGTLSCFPF